MHNVTQSATEEVGRSFLGGPGGVGEWYRSTDHKRISLMFLGWTACAFLLAVILATMSALKSLDAPSLSVRLLFQSMTYQRLIQVVGWLIPAIPGILGFFLIPLQLGVKNMAFPVMSRWSLRSYVVGLLMMILSMATCPVGTGWTLDTQLSILDPGTFALLMFALCFMGLSWFLTGINFLVTVHHGRREGMGFFDMPLTTWGLYLYSYLLVVSGLVFAIIVLYLAAGRTTTKGLFGWQSDPMLWRTYFWFAIRPLAFFSLIPGLGVVSDVISGVARKASTGYRTLVGSMVALTGIAVVSYGMGLVGQGLSPAGSLIFSFLSLLAAVPVALISITWLTTLYRSSITCGAPAAFSLAFMLFAGITSLLGLFLASPSVGAYLGNTMFISAQLDYIIWGAAMTALLAGLHFWWPKMLGRPYNEKVAHAGAIVYLIGLNLALVPCLMMGTKGVPQDMAGLVSEFHNLSQISNLGWLLVYASLVLVVVNLLPTLWGNRAAAANPWGATTLEWTVPSPPPEDNFS